jgi:pyruvate dehydrogenase E1 component alpha subunit
MIANLAATDIRPGSMGRPVPGIEAAIVDRQTRTRCDPGSRSEPDATGELALRAGWPSMFRTYLDQPDRYARCFRDGWYLTGDLARRDADGYLWFLGRSDDVIKSAGHLIGPTEVEADPDRARGGGRSRRDRRARPGRRRGGQGVRHPLPGHEPTDELLRELHGLRPLPARPAVAPREIVFHDREPAQDPQRQDHAAAAQGAGARPARGRPSTLEGIVVTTPRRSDRAATTPARTRSRPDSTRPRISSCCTQMLRIRRFEERCVELYSARADPRLPAPLHRRGGHRGRRDGDPRDDDAVVSTYREHGHAIAKGIPMGPIMAEMFGKVDGVSRGRGGSMHLFDAATRFYGGNAIVAGGIPLAVGLALADRMQGRTAVTVCFFGEGAVDEGAFHESINLAALWDLPVLFACENNLYSMGMALERAEAQTDLALKAAGYADARLVGRRHGRARRRGDRATRRHRDPGWRRSGLRRVRDLPVPGPLDVRPGPVPRPGRGRGLEDERDPIPRSSPVLQDLGHLDDDALAAMEAEVAAEIDEAVAFAEASPLEPVEDLERFVTSEVTP